MQRRDSHESRTGLYISLAVLGVVFALVLLPYQFRSEAVTQKAVQNDFPGRTVSHEPGLENYDIRTVKSDATADALMRFRAQSGKTAFAIADGRDGFVRGEQELRTRVRTLNVEYNKDLMVPEVISPDVWKTNGMENLSGPTDLKRAEVLRNFVKQNDSLIGVSTPQADSLKVVADYMNPAGNMAFAQLEQRINGIPVFRGEIKAGFRKDGSMIRVINNLAPGLDYNSLSTNFGDPLSAVRSAASNINYKLQQPDVTVNDAASSDLKTVFGNGDWATTAEKMYFPTEFGVARPSWRVLIWRPVNAYYVIVDAETGTVLWRKNITEDQTASATYEVYTNPNAMINAADSPAPLTPGPLDPGLGTQAPNLTRSLVTLIGNEGDNSFNNNGWMTDGTNTTDGNAVEAGVDVDGTNGVDATQDGDGTCGTGCREFTSTWAPPPDGASVPSDAEARRGAVIQMFYVMNLYHDALYKLGFNEQSFNFQNDNFGRGGAGADRVSAEGQDSSGTNNANFSTPADGGRGRMQMYVWTGPTPDYDGTADADVIIHEVTHGTSNRLHGNSSGLGSNMSRGMGEGWGDFYGHVLLSEATDPINSIYTTGGYVTYLLTSGTDTGNYYYGIRRFPKAVMAFTGGPGNLPHNPLTFANLNAGNCSTFNGAFPRGPVGSSTCDQVHNAGEIWSSALWEVRSLMVTRLGWAAGSQKVLQVVTDGMKMAPLNPTFLQERDSIIAAAAALPAASADVADVREGFRIRGMGFSAEVISASPANVVEAFDFPNVRFTDPFSVSDAPGDNDGYPEPGENVLLSVPVENSTGGTITNVSVNINGGTPVSYGDITDGQTVTMQIPYTIPASLGSVACGGFHSVQINISSDVGSQAPVNQQFRLGSPVGGPAATFENTQATLIPGGQPGSSSGPADIYPSTIDVSGLSGNKVIKVELTDVNHTWVDDLDFMLESPAGQRYIFLSDAFGNTDPVATTFTISDGGPDGPAPDGGPLAPGDYQPFNSGAGDPFDAPAGAATHDAANGDTFLTAFGMDGSAMNGTWKLWIDDDAGGDVGSMAGWKITFESDDYVCSLGSNAFMDFDGDGRTDPSIFRANPPSAIPGPVALGGSTSQFWLFNSGDSSSLGMTFGSATDKPVPGDYTGDGKADVAFFRPSEGNWYILRSEDMSFFAFPFGTATDIPAPGDFDGDGKMDPAVYRPSEGTWYIYRSSDGGVSAVPFGVAEDKPVVGDYDGDGTDDIAVYRPSVNQYWHLMSTAGVRGYEFGSAGDAPVVGDFSGDGKDDVAFFRPSTAEWYVIRSEDDSFYAFPWGASTDWASPGDYDGDGTADAAVWRPSDGTWYINGSTSGFIAIPFGSSGDLPLPSSYLPGNPAP